MNGFYGVNMLMGFDTSAGVSLILILFYFLPALLAVLGRRDLKIPVCIANVVGVFTLFMDSFMIPAVIWILLMIIVITGRRSRGRAQNARVDVEEKTYIEY